MADVLLFVFAVMFIGFAYLNMNDADAWIWVCTYLSAAAVCVLAYFRYVNLYAYMALVLYYVVFAVRNWPAKWEGVTMPMSHSIHVEKGRESLGLLICASCTLYSYWAATR